MCSGKVTRMQYLLMYVCYMILIAAAASAGVSSVFSLSVEKWGPVTMQGHGT